MNHRGATIPSVRLTQNNFCTGVLFVMLICVSADARRRVEKIVETPPDTNATVAVVQPTAVTRPPAPPAILVPQWVGHRFYVMPMSPSFRQFGYELYPSSELDNQKTPVSSATQLKNKRYRYEILTGRTLIAREVQPRGENFIVTFTEDSTGMTVCAPTHRGAIKALALSEDLERAQQRWLGATVYARKRQINTYDSTSGKMGSIKVSINTPLLVIGVQRGRMPLPPQPLWLQVSAADTLKGFIPVHISWTNVMSDMRTQYDPWTEFVLEDNPRATYSWDDETWANIDQHRLVTGMSTDQARLCWGDPAARDTTEPDGVQTVRWTYKGQYLNFVNGKLQQTVNR